MYHCVIHICTCTIAGFTFIHVPLCDSHWYMYHCRIHIYTCILQGSHLYMYTVGFTFIHVPLQDSHLYMYHCRIHIFIFIHVLQEMIVTQEEFAKQASEFHHYRQQVQGEMALLQVREHSVVLM